MERLSRAQTQQLNRARVLRAARQEFAARGFREAKVDGIAERAGRTRGAVYSNFPGKRALYFAVLAELAEQAPESQRPQQDMRPGQALGAFARAWVARLPLTTDDRHGSTGLGMDLLAEVIADERTRLPFAQLLKLQAILLGLAMERVGSPQTPPARQVGVAEAALTTLYGAAQLAAAAPGFVEPFNVVSACERLAGLELRDTWPPPHLPWAPQPRPADEPWSPPAASDALRGEPVPLEQDGVLAVLGLHRLESVEEAVRAAPQGAPVTLAMVTGDPGELTPLARLVMAELRHCLRQSFAPRDWPRLRVVFDDSGELATAAGLSAVSDGTEAAIAVRAARVVARADGRGACHAAAGALHEEDFARRSFAPKSD